MSNPKSLFHFKITTLSTINPKSEVKLAAIQFQTIQSHSISHFMAYGSPRWLTSTKPSNSTCIKMITGKNQWKPCIIVQTEQNINAQFQLTCIFSNSPLQLTQLFTINQSFNLHKIHNETKAILPTLFWTSKTQESYISNFNKQANYKPWKFF